MTDEEKRSRLSKLSVQQLDFVLAKPVSLHNKYEGYAKILKEMTKLWEEILDPEGSSVSIMEEKAFRIGCVSLQFIHDITYK